MTEPAFTVIDLEDGDWIYGRHIRHGIEVPFMKLRPHVKVGYEARQTDVIYYDDTLRKVRVGKIWEMVAKTGPRSLAVHIDSYPITTATRKIATKRFLKFAEKKGKKK